MADVTSYSAQNFNLNWLGHNFTGFADGDDAIVVERNTPNMVQTVGMQGDGVYTQSSDKSATITVKLLQSSTTNLFLTNKQQASEAGLIASGPMIGTEAGSASKFTANKTVIEGAPSFTRGMGHNPVEWTFLSFDTAVAHGEGVAVA